jgi:hypothetical protein
MTDEPQEETTVEGDQQVVQGDVVEGDKVEPVAPATPGQQLPHERSEDKAAGVAGNLAEPHRVQQRSADRIEGK